MKNKSKILPMEAYFLIAFAVIADLINWIPVVNWFVTLITLPAYQLYFYLKGMRGIYSLGGNIIEFIPGVSVLPGITIGVVLAIIFERLEKTKVGGKILKPVEKIVSAKSGTPKNIGQKVPTPVHTANPLAPKPLAAVKPTT
ncbi:MAG: hypothetical protein A3I24_02980 [Candidatus Harrisonbacteria bacterium RIFCSPLOWO2_02_FULL_41_13b]|uniref:Uncharacterized protein n=1 Tax=Candidatus Harrisonbacteria bacterium RIFCSPLOWO2_02_FULL_41_13b TaxID=1798409 RepID=A0A1G1ZV55_9BACT|nr:MAG: hypothetical protein A3I24_02980 [Candidatus Harrisonbacteria bacterium RIFCSPLOWO2_02_FULL_41_13b]